jgi:hypothetical protein
MEGKNTRCQNNLAGGGLFARILGGGVLLPTVGKNP